MVETWTPRTVGVNKMITALVEEMIIPILMVVQAIQPMNGNSDGDDDSDSDDAFGMLIDLYLTLIV